MRQRQAWLRIVALGLLLLAGAVSSSLALAEITTWPGPAVTIGARRDFAAGPIHGAGALVQWFSASAMTVEEVHVRPTVPSEPHDLRLSVRLLDSSRHVVREVVSDLNSTGADGWWRVAMPPLRLTSGREYGLQISLAQPDAGYLFLEATAYLRTGWRPIGSRGLEINGVRKPAEALVAQVRGAGGIMAAARMSWSAASAAPGAALSLTAAALAWLVAAATLSRWLAKPLWSARLVPTLASLTTVAATLGLLFPVAAWMLGA